MLSLFNTKNLRRCIFRAFSGLDCSRFIKAAPTYGYFLMACTVFTNRLTIFDSNSHGASNVELIPSLKKETGCISNVFLLLRFFSLRGFLFLAINFLSRPFSLEREINSMEFSSFFPDISWKRGFWIYRSSQNIFCGKSPYPADNYKFKVNNRNTKTRSEICSKVRHQLLTYFTPCFFVSFDNFEQVNAGWA